MAHPAPRDSVLPPKQKSLFEVINKLDLEGDEVAFQLMEELDEQEVAAIGFRWLAESTKDAQDRILRDYERYLVFFKIVSPDCSDKERDEIAFPAAHKALFTQLRKFMIFVARYGRGRGIEKTHISYRGLVKYRAATMFWALRSHQQRELPPIPVGAFFNRLTEAMRSAAKHYNLSVVGSLNRTTVGLPELRQLIDMDMISTPSIEVAEGHHLAWCIGKVYSVRPGNISPSGKGDKIKQGLYLTWRDVTITRGRNQGEFSAKIIFRAVKTNSDDPEISVQTGGGKTLTCNVLPPKRADNLVFSVPHRLLVIALRRGILVDITSLDELLKGQQYEILIKEACLDDPIVLASNARGLGTSDKPCAAAKLTSYLQLRGKRLGYTDTITFYSIRRRDAQDLAEILGPDMARIIMGHDADSRTLERYYVNLLSRTDLNATLLEEPANKELAKDTVEKDAPLALQALSHKPEVVKRIHGPALNALVRKLIASDKDFPIGGSDRDKKNYRRRISNAAFKTLLAEETQKQRQTLKRSDIDSRVQSLKSSSFVDQILRRARESLKSGAQDDTVDLPGIQDTGEFGEEGYEEPAEADFEDLLLKTGSSEVTRESDEVVNESGSTIEAHDADTALEDVPYEAAVKSFMEIVLDNSTNEHVDLLNNPVHCHLCEEDDSVPEAQKSKTYNNPSHLLQHVESVFHSQQARWKRENQIQHDEAGDRLWYCPYCPAVEIQDQNGYANQKSLIVHIQKSTKASHGNDHDIQKEQDGWYDKDFRGIETETRKRRHSEEKAKVDRKILRRYNFKYSDEVELLVAIPHPSLSGVVLGGPRSKNSPIPDDLNGLVSFSDPDKAHDYEVLDRFMRLVKYAGVPK